MEALKDQPVPEGDTRNGRNGCASMGSGKETSSTEVEDDQQNAAELG